MALTDDIIGYWKVDESSGNATDSVNSNTATNTGVTYAAGKINNGADFNATTDVLYVGNPAALQITGAHTFNFWLKCSSQTGLVSFLFKGGIDGFTDMNWGLMKYSSSDLVYQASNGTNISDVVVSQTNANADFFTNTWNMVTCVYSPSTSMTIYLNGTSYASDTVSIISSTLSTKGLSFGRITTSQSGNARDSFIGMMDEIGIWSRALSGSEITELYNSGNGLSYPFTSTVNSGFFGLM